MNIRMRRMSALAATAVATVAAISLVPQAATAKNDSQAVVEFGLIADTQYCDCENKGTRHYRGSLDKLSQAVKTINEEDVDFTIQTGDIIDRHPESFDAVLPIWDQLEAPKHHTLGNHDFPFPTDQVVERLGMENQYYDFSADGWRFVVLDTNDISTYANEPGSAKYTEAETILKALTWAGDPNAKSWNGGVGQEQMEWFKGTLQEAEAAGEKTIVIGHMPIAPLDQHNAWNDAAIVKAMEDSGTVAAYFNGHNHVGNYYAERNGIHYVNLQGMVEGDTNAFSVVSVYKDTIEIDGYGREADRKLKIG